MSSITEIESFLFMREKMPILEEIINQHDTTLSSLKEKEHDPLGQEPRDHLYASARLHDFLNHTSRQLEVIMEIQKRCKDEISYAHRQKLAEAESDVLEKAQILVQHFPTPATLEERLDLRLHVWNREKNMQKKREQLRKILEDAATYHAVNVLHQAVRNKAISNQAVDRTSPALVNTGFYDDIISLTFIAETQTAEQYIKEYAKADTEPALQRIKETMQEFWMKREQQRKKMHADYQHSLFSGLKHPLFSGLKDRCHLIDAEPDQRFIELQADIDVMLAHPQPYLARQKTIRQKIEGMQHRMELLEQASRKIDEDNSHYCADHEQDHDSPDQFVPQHHNLLHYLDLVNDSINIQNQFKIEIAAIDNGSLYLQENLQRHRQLLADYQQSLKDHRGRCSQYIDDYLNVVVLSLATETAVSDRKTYLEEKEKQLKAYAESMSRLGITSRKLDYADSKISNMKQYYAASKRKEEAFERKEKALEVPTLSPEEHPVSQLEKHLIMKNPLRDDTDDMMPVPTSATGLLRFAYEQRVYLGDETMRRCCAMLAGIDDNGWDFRTDFATRLQKAKAEIAKITPTSLNRPDLLVYKTLKSGMMNV